MLDPYFRKPMTAERTLQQQVRERLVDAILDGAAPPHEPLPSTRELAALAGVSRNTAVLVYQQLIDDGFLRSIPRRGHFIDERHLREVSALRGDTRTASLFGAEGDAPADWEARFALNAHAQRNIEKPSDWRRYPYPFLYGQVSADDASVARWRDAVRAAGSNRHVEAWIGDQVDGDDPMLIAQILTRILPQRGIRARAEEVLVTVGSQNALYLIAQALTRPGLRVGLEDPGYVDAFNIFRAAGAELAPLRVDGAGLIVSDRLDACDLVCVTPSHQCPTGVTLPLDRRMALTARAREADFLVIEDDYEHELNHIGPPRAALKSYDTGGRVIYAGSLTKTLFPGLRLGFVVAAPALIEELRALRRLMYRHPPALDQRAMAIFMAEGHLDAHVRRTRARLAARWTRCMAEISARMPEAELRATSGGSAIWLRLPGGLDARAVAQAARARGVLVEPGDVHYLREAPPVDRLRLGFAAIPLDRIAPGIAQLADAVREVAG